MGLLEKRHERETPDVCPLSCSPARNSDITAEVPTDIMGHEGESENENHVSE